MRREDKRAYLEDYERRRGRGTPYFPDVMIRDVLVAAGVVVVLVGLSAWFTAPLDPKADPLDTSYVPRPEWYFFFIFQLLKYFPGDWEVVGVVVLPLGTTLLLFLLPVIDRSRRRHYAQRPVVMGATFLFLGGAFALTAQAAIEAPPPGDATEAGAVFSPTAAGAQIYADQCAACHGAVGEGGANPARVGDVIAPISTEEYLSTRGDTTLRAIIEKGQPDFGMSPFGISFGGPLEDQELDAVVAFMRSWEADPPVELPPEVSAAALSQSADYLYPELCAQCHGVYGEGGLGPAFADPAWQETATDAALFDAINLGHPATAMIAWGEILNSDQITGLVAYIRRLGAGPADVSGPVRFSTDVLPIFDTHCNACHGVEGGWDGTTYASALASGNSAPVIIPGDPGRSLLVAMMRGESGLLLMPPAAPLPPAMVDKVVAWIESGALE